MVMMNNLNQGLVCSLGGSDLPAVSMALIERTMDGHCSFAVKPWPSGVAALCVRECESAYHSCDEIFRLISAHRLAGSGNH